MKKCHTILSALSLILAFGTAKAADDNSLYFTNAIVMPGQQTNIEVNLRNTATDLTCIEAELALPEGLSFAVDETGDPVCSLLNGRAQEHELLANILENGNLKLLISSAEGALIRGNDGAFISICIEADTDALSGDYQVETVGESLLVDSNAEAYYNVGIAGGIMITDDPTGIDSQTAFGEDGTANGKIYNLAGQQISNGKRSDKKLPRGINIVGGKKVLNK